MCTENFHFFPPKKSDKLWQVSGGLIAHLPPQNTLPAKWPPKPPFWLNIDCLGEKVLRLRLVVVVESGKYTAAQAGSLERRARWEERQSSGGDKNIQGWLLEWETHLGMVMMKKTSTRTSKAGFLNGKPTWEW